MDDMAPDEPRLLPEQRAGAALREAREGAGISLRQMAKRLGYHSHTTLSAYERGSVMPTEQVVEGYEQVLGLPRGQLAEVLEAANIERHGDAFAKRRVHIPRQFGGEPPPKERDAGPSWPRRHRLALLLTIGIVLGGVAVITAVQLLRPAPAITPASSPGPSLPPPAPDRGDPATLGCSTDAVNADVVQVHYPPQYIAGLRPSPTRHAPGG